MIAFRHTLSLASIVSWLVFSQAARANPETAVDFSSTTNSVDVIAHAFPDDFPTVLRAVSVKCPAAGYLVAMATAQFDIDSAGGPDGDEAAIEYGITRNTIAFDYNRAHNLYYSILPVFEKISVPGSIQRIDSCSALANHTYRFVARRGDGTAVLSARQPSLVVQFFRDKI